MSCQESESIAGWKEVSRESPRGSRDLLDSARSDQDVSRPDTEVLEDRDGHIWRIASEGGYAWARENAHP